MNADEEKLKELISSRDPGRVDDVWLDEIRRRYPFFVLPDALTGHESLRLALIASDPAALARLITPDGDKFNNFYPAEKQTATPTTNQAIDTFLDNYGSNDPAENELLERLIFNPVPDYAQQLAQQEEASLPDASDAAGDSPEERLNRFILNSRRNGSDAVLLEEPAVEEKKADKTVLPHSKNISVTQETQRVKAPGPQPDESLLSESLAKIYIKTGRYERAYEILSRLSLRFPEKNAYFADQLRFLRKIILNQQFKQKKNHNR